MKKRYDWLFIIKDQDLDFEFNRYCREHKKVKSLKRLARSFVVSRKENFRLPCYELGKTESICDFVNRVNWIED